MYITTLRKVGGSVMLSVSPAILDMLDLRAGEEVGLEVDGKRLVVERQKKPRYSLEELLAQCDASADLSEENREWVDVEPVGLEI